MKTAYELAMERLAKSSPTVKLTAAQKKQIAELDSRYKAKIAQKEIQLKEEIIQATGQGDMIKAEQLEQELVCERAKLNAELEDKKERMRNEGQS